MVSVGISHILFYMCRQKVHRPCHSEVLVVSGLALVLSGADSLHGRAMIQDTRLPLSYKNVSLSVFKVLKNVLRIRASKLRLELQMFLGELWYLVPGTWHLIALAPGIWYLVVFGTWC